MKKRTVALILALTAPVSMPVFAGPNWDAIHKAEARALQAGHEHESASVLPLDYGPRALTTPWLNKERLISEADAQKKLAAAASDKKNGEVAAHAHAQHATHS